jgi:hypothetical protein
MRNELKYIQLIEKYLMNKLSSTDKQEFEARLKTDKQLEKDVEKQKLVMEGAKRMGLKNSAQKGFKKFKIMKNLKYIATTIVAIGAAVALYYGVSNNETKTNSPEDLLPEQGFVINNAQDTVIETENGMVLVIPENAFVDENGNLVSDVDFEVKEAFETTDILKAGLTTMADGRLLETGGMFFLNAYSNGKKLKLAEGKKILAEIPNINPREDMMLFDGEKKEDGTINWVNPKPFEKDLITYDITTLDFYPEGYLEELKTKETKILVGEDESNSLYENELVSSGLNTNDKQFTDSLYYSFARLFDGNIDNEDGQELVMLNIPTMEEGEDSKTKLMKKGVHFDGGYYVFNKKNVFKQIENYNLIEKNTFESVITYLSDNYGESKSAQTIANFQFKGIMSASLRDNIGLESKDNFDDFLKECKSKGIKWLIEESFSDSNAFDTSNYDNAPRAAKSCTPKGINPARIKTIWNKKFNKTILATKEFETRLRVIHEAHNDALLNVYVSNINKPLWYCDSLASTIAGGFASQFTAFYKQKKGGVKVNDRLTSKLSGYYEKKQKDYTEKSSKAYQDFEAKKQKLTTEFVNKKGAKDIEEFNRKAKVFNEELVLNLDEAYRQIGKERTGGRGAPFVASVGLGPKNLDAYVFESTANRTTLDYTDPETGKKAVIKYEEASVKMLNTEKFDRVFVYMVPDSLNSFNRMKTIDNINFKNTLNEFFNYKMVCLAYKGDQAYFYEGDLSPQHYDVTLTKISEPKLKRKLNKNKGTTKKDIISDVNFYQEEMRFNKTNNKIKVTEELTLRVGKFLFPSLDDYCIVGVIGMPVYENIPVSSTGVFPPGI